jgi:hypothetical protein
VAANPTWLYRGYTGHEHLSEFNLINMNAQFARAINGLTYREFTNKMNHL